jgi:hypothetical protein
MGKIDLKILRGAIKREQDLRRQKGFDDQDVLELHERTEELKLLYMELGHLQEELELLQEVTNYKFKKGMKKVLSLIFPGRFYLIQFSLKNEFLGSLTTDADLITRNKDGNLELLASLHENWSLKHDVFKVYCETYLDQQVSKKEIIPYCTAEEVTDFSKCKDWKYISPKIKKCL